MSSAASPAAQAGTIEHVAQESPEGIARLILDSANDAFIAIRADHVITDWNRRAEEVFGWTRDEALGHQLPELIIPVRYRDAHRRGMQHFLQTGSGLVLNRRLQLPALRRSGEEFPVELTISPVRVGNGHVFAAFIQDISERANAAEAIAKLSRQNELLLKSAGEGIYGLDAEGITTFVNPAAARMLGYDPEELIGRPQHDLIHHTRADGTPYPREQCLIHAAIREGTVHQVWDEVFWRKDGTSFPVHYTSTPIREDQAITGAVVVFRDVSDRIRAEEALARQARELRQSNAELEQFAYVASHDLQEPLRMVASYTQLLGKRYRGKLGPEADEFIHFAVDGAQRMQNLINDLLAYSRVGTRGKPFEQVDVGLVVKTALHNLAVAIEEREATVNVLGTLPTIMADPGQLVQVFQNLIGNAIKFAAEGRPPRVTISAERREEAGDWLFRVADNGIGIEPQHHDRIFTIFQRLHTREQYPGTGIGLAIVRKVVERHGGHITVESTVGEGSIFAFNIPDWPGDNAVALAMPAPAPKV